MGSPLAARAARLVPPRSSQAAPAAVKFLPNGLSWAVFGSTFKSLPHSSPFLYVLLDFLHCFYWPCGSCIYLKTHKDDHAHGKATSSWQYANRLGNRRLPDADKPLDGQLIGLNGNAYTHGAQVIAWEVIAAVGMVVMALYCFPRYWKGRSPRSHSSWNGVSASRPVSFGSCFHVLAGHQPTPIRALLGSDRHEHPFRCAGTAGW